jgi:aerobic-type carbon monoxide dehydrogenase small subunit (CoxS/CutS family)
VRLLHPGHRHVAGGAHRDRIPADEAVRDVLDGHLCRCTGYVNIRAAVERAWAAIDGGAP